MSGMELTSYRYLLVSGPPLPKSSIVMARIVTFCSLASLIMLSPLIDIFLLTLCGGLLYFEASQFMCVIEYVLVASSSVPGTFCVSRGPVVVSSISVAG